VIPGAGRDIPTPYGTIRVFEWGPATGEKVLLLHGIGTPCLALSDLGHALVAAGYRVMLFDFFGRGYSDAPVDLPYDLRLYATQILLVLASSPLAWAGDDGFHLLGYSLGAGVAVSFARYFAHMVRSVTLVAGSGIIRRHHVSFRSRVLYSTGWFPEWMLQYLVRERITPKEAVTESTLARETVKAGPVAKEKNSDASGGDSFDNAPLSRRRPGHTVASVMAWQIKNHQGFIPAFMSSIRFAPIYERKEDWLEMSRLLAERRMDTTGEIPGLRGGKILIVLGDSDPVILKDELVEDAAALLGPDGFDLFVLEGGHEIAIAKGDEVAEVVVNAWKKRAHVES
jgi:pimeloyl-ACP methyl ester carboxylesterase